MKSSCRWQFLQGYGPDRSDIAGRLFAIFIEIFPPISVYSLSHLKCTMLGEGMENKNKKPTNVQAGSLFFLHSFFSGKGENNNNNNSFFLFPSSLQHYHPASSQSSPTEGTQLPKAPNHPASGTECSFWSPTTSHCVALLCGTRGHLCTVLMWLQLLHHRSRRGGVLLLLLNPLLTQPSQSRGSVRLWLRIRQWTRYILTLTNFTLLSLITNANPNKHRSFSFID